MNKKTHEEFVKELAIKNPTIVIYKDVYRNKRTHINCECLACGIVTKKLPQTVLKGKKCYNCARIQNTKTHEQFEQELQLKNPCFIILKGTYRNSFSKMVFKCKAGGHVVKRTPGYILSGYKCVSCKKNYTKHISHEEFREKLLVKNQNLVVYGDTYRGTHIKIQFLCKVCGDVFKKKPVDIMSGTGCKTCNINTMKKRYAKSHLQFVEELRVKNPFISVYKSIYKNVRTKMDFKCLECGRVTRKLPYMALIGGGCKYCNRGFISEKYFLKNTAHKGTPAILYLVKSKKEWFIKIGVTRKTVLSRFSGWGFEYKIVLEYHTTLYTAWKLEQLILKKFSKFCVEPEILKGNGNTECFTEKLSTKKIKEFIKASTKRR